MAVPTYAPSTTGNVYVHVDGDSGKLWSYSLDVWTPVEPFNIGDLSNVRSTSSTSIDALDLVRTKDVPASSVVADINGGQYARIEFESGYDFLLDRITIGYLYNDATVPTSTVNLEVFQGTADPAFSGAALNLADYTTLRNNLGDPVYSSSVSVNSSTPTFFTFFFTGNTIMKRGRFTGIFTVDPGPAGPVYYSGDFESNYGVNGYRCTSGPIEGSVIKYESNVWQSTPPVSQPRYNVIVRSTVDPTPADVATNDVGTFWVNTTTDTLFILDVRWTGAAAAANTAWHEVKAGDNFLAKPARVHLSSVEPSTASATAGDTYINTSTDTLYVFNGTSWETAA